MTDKLVFNINFYLYIRFVFGFYHDFQTSKRVQWLARCYCFLVSAFIFIILCSFHIAFYPSSLIYTLTTAEYVLYVLISLRKNNKYLLQYYKKMPLIDDVTINTYKPMRLCLIGYIWVLFLVRIFEFIKFLVFISDVGKIELLYQLLGIVIWCAITIGRLPVLFVLALLYTRMKSMRKMLESNDFECRNRGRHHPRRYIQMYEAIMDGLEKKEDPMKLQLFVFVVFSTAFYIIVTLYNLHFLKEYNGSASDVPFTSIFFKLLFDATLGYSPLVLSAVLSDMVTMEVQEILTVILDRRIVCNNERDRAEIQMLFQLVKERPFDYSLWRVVPLNLRSLLSFLSFSITTVIAILQIHSLNSTI